jgi:16S rRNA (cytosine967-C5)-methyltransferase
LAFEVLLPYQRFECDAHRLNQTAFEQSPKLNDRLDKVLQGKGVTAFCSRGKLKQLTLVTLQQWFTVSQLLETRLKQPIRKLKPELALILRLALIEGFYLQQEPDYAVVSSWLKIADSLKLPVYLKRVMNGTLRSLLRDHPEVATRKQGLFPHLTLPSWLPEPWKQSLSAEALSALHQSMQEGATGLGIRINTTQSTPLDYAHKLEASGISATKSPDPEALPEYLYLPDWQGSVTKLPGFEGGDVYVQNESSAWVIGLLDPKPQETILDVCAAPGSKTTHVAQRLQGQGHITALELNPQRAERIRENWQRLQLPPEMLTLHTVDALDWTQQSQEVFDAVLVDAPCTALGTLRRHPELWFRLHPDGLEELIQLQQALLRAASSRVKSGGRLLYSTCSVFPSENERVLDAFLESEAGSSFRCVHTEQRLPTPSRDGFFAALLRRERV